MYNACYGGTAALLTCTNWVQSWGWDGRWAVAIATDIADAPEQYRFMVRAPRPESPSPSPIRGCARSVNVCAGQVGAAACAILVGPDAPLRFERERVTHIVDRWDFYKPIGWPTMAPIVDGPGSIDVYFSCMDACQRQITQRVGYANNVEDHDYLVYHLGSGPKFVKHCFERTVANAYHDSQEGKKKGRRSLVVSASQQDHIFDAKVAPSLVLASRIGPMHTVSTYTNLLSLMITLRESLLGKQILAFSYGSGAASTIWRIRVDALPTVTWDKHAQLDGRRKHSAKEFESICSRYANTYAKFGWKVPRLTPRCRGRRSRSDCGVVVARRRRSRRATRSTQGLTTLTSATSGAAVPTGSCRTRRCGCRGPS